MRFAIVSTPRSGNTWLLHLLSNTYEIPFFQVHNPVDFDWDSAPTGCVVQCHWHPSATFLDLLHRNGYQPIVLSRHPLDTLISILHFAINDPTERWLEGEGGTEQSIVGAMPRSTAFLGYASSPRARALLNLTPEWWQLPSCRRVKYEDLVADTENELCRLVEELQVPPKRAISVAVDAVTFTKLRKEAQNRHGSLHFWQGKPGHWRRLLPAAEANHIFQTHESVFRILDYACDPDSALTGPQADLNWIDLFRAEVADKQQIQRNLKKRIETLESRVTELESRLQEATKQCGLTADRLVEAQLAYQNLQQLHYTMVGGIGPRALNLARRLSGLSRRHPRTSSLLRRMLRLAS